MYGAEQHAFIKRSVERGVQYALWTAFTSNPLYREDARGMSLRAWLVRCEQITSKGIEQAGDRLTARIWTRRCASNQSRCVVTDDRHPDPAQMALAKARSGRPRTDH